MEIFYGKNKRGIWRASLNYDTIMKYTSGVYDTTTIPVLHNGKVYMILVYTGFDYTSGGIVDCVSHSKVFHSVNACKKSDQWREYQKIAERDPENHIFDRVMIASKNSFGEPFEYGDCMEGKFNMKIIGVKVI